MARNFCPHPFLKKKEVLDPKTVNIELKDILNKNEIKCEIYTDGSKNTFGTSYAFVVNSTNAFSKKKNHPAASIYTAESTAVQLALKYICDQNDEITRYSILTDSRSILDELVSVRRNKNENTKQILNLIQKNVIIVWVPDHNHIPGNEMVDELKTFLKTIVSQKLISTQ